MSLIKSISKDIYRLIYKFINPISMKYIIDKKVLWCIKCGEILEKGDWFLNLEDEEYLLYECIKCGEENFFYEEADCDIILSQEKV